MPTTTAVVKFLLSNASGMYSYDRRGPTKTASLAGDAQKIVALLQRNFDAIDIDGHGSSSNVVFTITIGNGLFQAAKIAPFAEGLGVNPKKVTLR